MQAIPPKRAAFAAGLPAQGRSVLDVAGVLTADLLTAPGEPLRAPPEEGRPPRSALSSFHPRP